MQARFPNVPALREELFRQLSVFPIRLLRFFQESPDGQLVVLRAGAEYDPETAVAVVAAHYVANNPGVVREELAHLLDHLLGSYGRGRRMSEGAGINPGVEAVGQQLQNWYIRKSGAYYNPYAARNEREYLAQGVREYFRAPDLLEANDQELFHFIESQFLDNSFWMRILNNG
jgi:hypothetical protein